MKQNRILSLLGIAMKGRNLVSGEFQTLDAIRNGSAMLVIVAEDASGNTRKLFTDKCSYYGVPVELYGTKEGYRERLPVVAGRMRCGISGFDKQTTERKTDGRWRRKWREAWRK